MKILNLYCGIGGNRKLWGGNHEITAIEKDPNIARIYQDFFPNDKVIVTDAHEYLLENYINYDFIFASPPCPTHSDIRRCGVHRGQNKAVYPDMTLYQEIILLDNFYKGLFCIENVRPYYIPLIPPTYKINRHLFWCNFIIHNFNKKPNVTHEKIKAKDTIFGFNLNKYKIDNKVRILRNMVFPDLGKHILDNAYRAFRANRNIKRDKLILEQKELF